MGIGSWVWRGVATGSLLLAVSTTRPLSAQVPRPVVQPPNPLLHAFDLERRGSYPEAAAAYRAILRADSANESAILGLERNLASQEKTEEMVPEIRAALALRPTAVLYGVALRVWSAAGQPDSMRRIAEQWAALEGDKAVPYRTWGDLMQQRRDFAGARRAYLAGRAAAGDPDALAAELAGVAQLQGEFAVSAAEWRRSLRQSSAYRIAAINALIPARAKDRAEVLRALAPDSGGEGAMLAAVLLAQWGEPIRGADILARALSDSSLSRTGAADLLASFIDQVRPLGTRDAKKALGTALELLGARQTGSTVSRTRLEAARAYADGGDPASAHRMLALIAGDRNAGPDLAVQAARTLLEVQIADGALDEAERTFTESAPRFGVDDRAAIRRRLAEAWIQHGDLGRADRLAADDSTVEGLALAGRLALLRGDLRGARSLLQQAGPYAGTREESTERTALLALIQPIDRDSLPELGAALLAGERGDTAAAIAGLDRAAAGLAPAKGGASLALAAAELAWAKGAAPEAERRLKAVAATGIPATAAAAELDLARLLVSLGRRPEGVAQLEHLILTYPQSAFIPQARRLLDEARNAVPTT
jgi:hypothetical protein